MSIDGGTLGAKPAAGGLAQPRGGGVALAAVARADEDVPALAGEDGGELLPDPAVRAGDQHGLGHAAV